ncbi:putative F-box protein PP2-B12 [Euphorbia lathyris]|uniref:putative F-box protein PP2-B12 n=1 Tax=Euphorbia lathyris TaxID=212925 RepID=UPI0033138575
MSGLPEGCLANILSFTNPKTACVLSAVSSAFKNAAESDTVWEKFLPSDYQMILSGSNSPVLSLLPKKQLFLSLCNNPILIDNGRKSFSLAKWSGKKCFMLSARDLQIVWGDYSPHWKWTSDPNSRFEEVAGLVNVSRLEINGKIDTNRLSTSTMYTAFLVFKLHERAYGLNSPVAAMLGIDGEELSCRNVYLDGRTGFRRQLRRTMYGDTESLVFVARRDICRRRLPNEREDGWLEVELGQFFNAEGTNGELGIHVKSVESQWKGGLLVEGIEIRPS